jgi:mono/diheme cytochrome c family protein
MRQLLLSVLAVAFSTLATAAVLSVSPQVTVRLSAQGGGSQPPAYTEEQSARGAAIYTKACGPCHDDKSLAPLLQGDVFAEKWTGKTVAALFEKIQTTMPLQDPGTLAETQSLDLVAYILKMNRVPPGSQPLAKDASLDAMSLSLK